MDDISYPRLLGDVGGTNARFAWQAHAGAALSAVATHPCRDFASLHEAIVHHLRLHGLGAPRACGIGIANPITGDQVRMTNHHWSFSIDGLQAALGVRRLVVVNDFTALALAIPSLPADDLKPLGGGQAVAGTPVALIGPGTGLGVSGLVPAPDGTPTALTGEGGHVTLAPADDDEAAVVDRLRRRFGHASAERALSGPGLVNLYEAACALAGGTALPIGAAEVIERARGGTDTACRRALDHFCALLGSVAGNLALTLGARGGVYIGGGIAPRLLDELRASRFRERFEGKGRMQPWLAAVPTVVIASPVSPALAGVSRALDLAG